MKIEKESFYVFFVMTLTMAAIMAYFFGPITDEFVVPTMVSVFGLKGPAQSYAHYFSPDVSFLSFFIIIGFVIIRAIERLEPIVYLTYGASLFFCFFYFFIAPLESLFVLPAFVTPVFFWHQNRIGNGALTLISLMLIAGSWYFLQKPAIFILMLPMCHLFAIRANNALQSRYAGREVRILSRLSSTQQKKTAPTGNLLKKDLWSIIGPEIEALADSWAQVKETSLGIPVAEPEALQPTNRPRGVLSSMLEIQEKGEMKRAIAAIKQRDPKFSPEAFIDKFRVAFEKIHQACYDHKIETIQPMVSDALYEQFRCRVDEQKEAGVKFSCPKVNIQTIQIARVTSDGSFDEVHVMVTAEAVETAIDIVTGETLNAENQNQAISEFWSFIRRPSAKTLQKPGLLEGSCPNCGNPIEIGQATVCPVCSSFIRSGHYDWVLSQITQACEWEYANPRLVPGWNDLVASDPGFTIQQVEDRTAVIFWMIRLVERKRIMEPMLRFATEKACEFFNFALKGVKNYSYMENVSFASATLKAITFTDKIERLYVLLVWSGIPVEITPEGREPALHRFSRPRRDVLVLVRQKGMKTNINNTLSSAHCRKCGGPLTSNFAISCNYCNTILNDGAEWILEKTINEKSQEYIDIIARKKQLMEKVVVEVKREQAELKSVRSGRDMVTMAARMLLADGKVDPAEMNLLKNYAARFAMPENILNGIVESMRRGELFIPEPETPKESIELFDAAVSMAMADGEVSPEEQQYLETLMKKLGYTKTELNMAIRKATNRQKLEKTAKTKP
ncbi:MAG TPA: TIM44-like domain-containing protein [Candidatus Rifleibacterium sp.]|nr:TIM44-like domain-containing protein [Candidatus Rifleibacterium sp.]HPT45916.1 TIM44-like domain-containing protein [Candidatus Rifleibacterium sp.]